MHHHYLDIGLFVVMVVVVSVGGAAGGIALRRRIFAGPEQTRWREARLPLSHRQRIAVWWATARHRPTGRRDLARAQLAYAAYVQRSTDQTPLLKHRRLAGQLADDVPALGAPHVVRLVHGMLGADPDAIGQAAAHFAGTGRLTAEAFAREELACAAAGDRDHAAAALDAALGGYRRLGAVPDRDRALARTRALGIRRGPREPHRDADFGWASLTTTENRIAALVRGGLTNREIGTRLFVSPRTVQTHVSHILQKTGLRSRVEIARATGA